MLKIFGASSKQTLITVGVIILIILAALPGVYFYKQYQQAQLKLTNPTESARLESLDLVRKVGKLIDLPTGEDPSVVQVTDISKLSDQPFFAKAKNGDKILIYSNARLAILYDPTLNKIMNVAPVNINASSSASAGSTTSAQIAEPAKFILWNGTNTIGLTQKYQTELTSKVANIQVVDTDNAKRRDYASTIIIDLAGDKASVAQQIAQTLGISVSQLPTGENVPTTAADFLVILGADTK